MLGAHGRVAFASCQERKVFPTHYAPNRLGNTMSYQGDPHLGPGCYDNHEVSDPCMIKPMQLPTFNEPSRNNWKNSLFGQSLISSCIFHHRFINLRMIYKWDLRVIKDTLLLQGLLHDLCPTLRFVTTSRQLTLSVWRAVLIFFSLSWQNSRQSYFHLRSISRITPGLRYSFPTEHPSTAPIWGSGLSLLTLTAIQGE